MLPLMATDSPYLSPVTASPGLGTSLCPGDHVVPLRSKIKASLRAPTRAASPLMATEKPSSNVSSAVKNACCGHVVPLRTKT